MGFDLRDNPEVPSIIHSRPGARHTNVDEIAALLAAGKVMAVVRGKQVSPPVLSEQH